MPIWTIGAISTPRLRWGEVRAGHTHHCPTCEIDLLTGEDPGWCCGKNGKFFNNVPPLPPLPPEFDIFINDPRISKESHILNLIFSFASLKTTHAFPEGGAGPPGFFRIQGRVYHQ
ncbi:hypothetical protein JAAARDRAFT_143926, partial [Jaapia argillacea MUCL 33604]